MLNTIPSLLERGYRNWNNATVLTKVAESLENRSRLDYAIEFAKRAIELAPTASVDPYLTWAFACFRDPVTLPTEGNNVLDQAYKATGSGVARAWQAAVAEDAEKVGTYLEEARQDSTLASQIAIASALAWQGKIDESYDAYCALAQNFPADGSPEWGDYCSTMLFFKQRGKEVDVEGNTIPRLQRLIEANPDSLGARQTLMRCYNVLNNPDAAIQECLDILQTFPDEESTMLSLAGLYEKKGDDDRAIMWLNRAIGAKASYAGARLRLAAIYERQEKTALAESIMREIPLANPRYAYGAIELAYYLHKHGQEDEAATIFAEAYPRLYGWEKSRVENNEMGKVLIEKTSTPAAEAT